MRRSIYFMLSEWKKKKPLPDRDFYFSCSGKEKVLDAEKYGGLNELEAKAREGALSPPLGPWLSFGNLGFGLAFFWKFTQPGTLAKASSTRQEHCGKRKRDLSSHGGKCVCHCASTEQRLRGVVVVAVNLGLNSLCSKPSSTTPPLCKLG